MNCKQGDLAVVIRSLSGNEGRIVRLVRLHSSTTHDLDGMAIFPKRDGPRWVLEAPLISKLKTGQVFPLYTFPDSSLRPIRPQADDARDETLSWKRIPSPAKQGEPA